MTNHARWICSLLLIGVLLHTGASASGQESDHMAPTAQEIDAYIEDGMTQLNVPGAAVALFEDGKITHQRGFGRRNSSGDPVTLQTPFQIASVTKSFTSLIVLQLADEGRLSIDDPLVNYIPYFRTSNREMSKAITIRHLMNHRSGLSTLDGNRYQRTKYRGADATERAVRKLARVNLRAAPGEQFQYSNANYATLAHLIETIEQIPHEEVMEARIFSKIGMANTYVQIPNKPTAEEAKGHLQWFGVPREDHVIAGRMMMGAGGITTSAEDLAKYLIAISQNDPRIVPAALTHSWENNELVYEFGWQYDTIDGRRVIFHDGANPGFRAFVMYEPGANKGALFIKNMSGTLDGNLHLGAVRYALGMPSIDISPSDFFEKLLWGTLVLTVFLALACFFSLRRLIKNAYKPWWNSKPLRWGLIIFPSAVLVAFAFALWFYVPRTFGVNFASASLFNPDLGALLLAQVFIALTWASARTVFLVRRCRTHSNN
ncbi:MAG: serine hydrolase domain-containing protein [Parvularculaceae bacterium]